MADRPLDLPDPEDPFDEKLIADIHRYGLHWIHVADEYHPEHAGLEAEDEPDPVADAAFGYTIGLSLTLDHPEIIIVGRWKHAHAFVSEVVRLIQSGERFAPGDASDDVLPDLPVRFGAVSDHERKRLLTYADWANRRRPFGVVQLILPGPNGAWLWEPEYVALPQPLLA